MKKWGLWGIVKVLLICFGVEMIECPVKAQENYDHRRMFVDRHIIHYAKEINVYCLQVSFKLTLNASDVWNLSLIIDEVSKF